MQTTTPKPQAHNSRINALDLLRGFCLVVIVIDHLQFFPSAYDFVSGRAQLWLSAAEGFFFISGLLIGMIRSRDLAQGNWWKVASKCWRRAITLFLAGVILTLGYTIIGQFATAAHLGGIKGGLAEQTPWLHLIWQTITMRYTYGWADFLNYYVIYLLIAPFALWLIHRRGDFLVIGLSLAIWLAHFWWQWHWLDDTVTWQIYFFTGMVMGVRRRWITQHLRSLASHSTRWAKRVVVAAAATSMVTSYIYAFGPGWYYNRGPVLGWLLHIFHSEKFFSGIAFWLLKQTGSPFYGFLFNDNRHALLRYPVFLLWGTAYFLIFRRYEDWIMAKLGWLLLPLGRNSLYVYIISGVLAYAVHLAQIPNEFFLGTILCTVGILLVWYPTKRGWLFGIIPR